MSRLKPEERKEQILSTAVVVALRDGFNNFTRDGVAKQAGVSMGLINRYFSNMPKLRKAVMRRAIKQEILAIIGQGLAIKDITAKGKTPALLKLKALKSLLV